MSEMDLASARRLIGEFSKLVVDAQNGRVCARDINWKSVIPALNEAIEYFVGHAPSGDPMLEGVEDIQETIRDFAQKLKGIR